MKDLTGLLSAIEQGDPTAAEQLLPLVYDELRRLAAQRLAQERPGQTLQATALVHEAYVRIVGSAPGQPGWNSRNHFLAAAAEAMRRILIENDTAGRRPRNAAGAHSRVELDGNRPPGRPRRRPGRGPARPRRGLGPTRLRGPGKAELVKLRYFAGLSVEQAGEALGISRATAARHWDYARSWLYCELRGQAPPGLLRENRTGSEARRVGFTHVEIDKTAMPAPSGWGGVSR